MMATMDKLIDTDNLEAALQAFADARGWQPCHTPKNLVMALTGEVGELNEIFQWLSEAEAAAVMRDAPTAQHVREEVADVLLYLVRLSSVLGIDLDQAVRSKIALNAQKYPAPAR